MSQPPSQPPSILPQAFWDRVFLHEKAEWVADHPAQYFFDIFNQVGPFEREFRAAWWVLDVGPGRGRLLDQARGIRVAIEVSSINTITLASRGILTVIPGVEPHFHDVELNGNVDLAWSVSCFPHCDYEMQLTLLSQVYKALRPGGVFYLEHVMQKHGHPECPEEQKLPAGRYCVQPSDISWPGKSWRWIDRDVGDNTCPVLGWVARGVK